MITEATIQKVRDVAVADIIARYTKVTKNKACCPIHNEKTPSLSISKQGFFKCFGCGAGGDGIKFIEQMENVDFIAAVEKIAQMFNISIEYEPRYNAEEYKAKRAEIKSLRDHLQTAQQFFSKSLHLNAEALAYITMERGYNEDIIQQWQLGYAPNEWRLLTSQFKDSGHLPQAVQLGLVHQGDKNHYDEFRDRVMFPILDENGQLVSVAGRLFKKGAEGPKYINGCQSPIYNKSATLFGLYHAKKGIRREGYAILVEGYTDVISMHAAGADNTIGTCGTALTQAQCLLIKKETDTVVIMPDLDMKADGSCPGLEAASKSLHLLTGYGIRAEIFQTGEPQPGVKQDPDNYARKFFTKKAKAHEVQEAA